MECFSNGCSEEGALSPVFVADVQYLRCPGNSYPCPVGSASWVAAGIAPVCLADNSYGFLIAKNFTSGGYVYYAGDSYKGEWNMDSVIPASCFLKVWIVTRTSTYGVNSDVTTTLEWNGTGNPCIPYPDLGVLDESNQIHVGDHTYGHPAVGVSICVAILKYSFLPGYEPDISDELNPQPNGYPDPSWEVLPP